MRDGEIRVTAAVNGRRLTLDPIRVIPVTLEVREVESIIPCGFRAQWGETEVDGKRVELCSGAGFGSRWGTLTYGDRQFCFDVEQLVNAFITAIGHESEGSGATGDG